MRLHAQTAMIENGFVHLPEEAPWLAPYLAELTAFPNGKHDDQVDSTAQMLDWFKGAAREPGGFYGYYRMLAKELSDRQTVKPAPLPAGEWLASDGVEGLFVLDGDSLVRVVGTSHYQDALLELAPREAD